MRHRNIVGRIDDTRKLGTPPCEKTSRLRHDRCAFGIARPMVRSENADNGMRVRRHQRPRLKLPRIPRTMMRPSCVAMLRAADFTAASVTVSPRELRGRAGGGPLSLR